jgi:LCP family protein required for cell wall assembly
LANTLKAMAWRGYEQDRGLPGGHKALGWGLLVVGIAWAYLLLAVLSRALPAVLPGQAVDIPVLSGAIGALPRNGGLGEHDADHVFNEPITVLVLGADRRPDESPLVARADSIMVVRLDPATRRASALSVPRDLWVEIHAEDGSVYSERINASYTQGAVAGGSVGAGAEQVMRDLEANFGITASHYVWVDIRDAAEVIDAIGGVDVEVAEELAISDWLYTDDDVTNPVVLTFEPGEHHLSGYEAVAFARYREDSDLFRIERQQAVLRAVFERMLTPRAWLNPWGLGMAAADAIETDIAAARLPGIALLAGRAADDIALFSLGDDVDGVPTVYPIETADGAQVLGWEPANVAAIWAAAQQTR